MGIITILTGPSGVGKTTLEDSIIKNADVKPIRIYTTRPKRKTDCITRYCHVAREELHNDDDLRVYSALSADWMYALNTSELVNHQDYIISVITNKVSIRLKHILTLLGFDVKIVYIDRDIKYRINDMLERGETKDSINSRIMVEISDLFFDQLNADIVIEDYDYRTMYDSTLYSIRSLYA